MAVKIITESIWFSHEIHLVKDAGLIQMEGIITVGPNTQVDVKSLSFDGNEVGGFSGIVTDGLRFRYPVNIPNIKGSVTFDLDHKSVCVHINVTRKNGKCVDLYHPVAVDILW
ncbi:hypothetical protein N7517_009139 [Penicillium concentricum]|uniref:Uncharacterized protein n=1 Tax=Penicillium concentricum TaxID=293559 RepID=A0A9W9UWB9_9EURO|nr:uncharacterized protein N7517_009139 [Penicillium concentricum]KAJ5359948.1 hypothetical protein N7517_009139 [Penicillium concentricum]